LTTTKQVRAGYRTHEVRTYCDRPSHTYASQHEAVAIATIEMRGRLAYPDLGPARCWMSSLQHSDGQSREGMVICMNLDRQQGLQSILVHRIFTKA
jgi:hypothetical protein